MRPVAVIGAGAFGTALAVAFARADRPVTLYARRAEQAAAMREGRENAAYLPGIALPPGLSPVSSLGDLPRDAHLVLAVPAQETGRFLSAHGPELPDGALVLAAKGIDLSTGALQSELAARLRPNQPHAVLSGPGFADEIARGMPTALTLAAADPALGRTLQHDLSTPSLRLYRSTDLAGVQLGGALKNVVAIACGIAAGAGLGESARAALMTRGFAEITRLGAAMGARRETFTGLSGLGDLALTAASLKSRNFAAGAAIGQGGLPGPGKTVEGLATARAVRLLAERHEVEMPVAAATADVLDGRLSWEAAVTGLLSRPLKEEG